MNKERRGRQKRYQDGEQSHGELQGERTPMASRPPNIIHTRRPGLQQRGSTPSYRAAEKASGGGMATVAGRVAAAGRGGRRRGAPGQLFESCRGRTRRAAERSSRSSLPCWRLFLEGANQKGWPNVKNKCTNHACLTSSKKVLLQRKHHM